MNTKRRLVLTSTALAGFMSAVTFAAQGCTSPSGEACNSNAPLNSPPGSVVTYHNDRGRTGHNPFETKLTRANVNSATFGKIGSLPVDGVVYAQPLYLTQVALKDGSSHDLVFVATEHDSVYAFDGQTLAQVWKHALLEDCAGAGCTTFPDDFDPTLPYPFPNIMPEVGITATPIVDVDTQRIYTVAGTKENDGFHWRLHVLSILDGSEMPGSPTEINPILPGGPNADGLNASGMIPFIPTRELSRAGLVLTNGYVYVAFSSFDDNTPTHGWVLAFDTQTFKQVHAFNTSPNSGNCNVWMSGGAPAIDGCGNLFFTTANSNGAPQATQDYGNAVVKVSTDPASGMNASDYFKPYNSAALDVNDVDLGSGGVMLIPGTQPEPHPNLMVTAGKEGTVYLLDQDNMGQFNPAAGATSDSQIVQELARAIPPGNPGNNSDAFGMFSTPAYFNGTVFFAGANDVLRGIPLVNGLFVPSSNSMYVSTHHFSRRGATPSVSSNNGADGLIWVVDTSSYAYSLNSSNQWVVTKDLPAVLAVYSTDDLSKVLYASDSTAGAANAAGLTSKFTVPTVASGKVFVGTQTEVTVFGLK